MQSNRVDRASMPNYEDKQYSRAVFRDYGRVVHHYSPFIAWKINPYKGNTLTINKDGDREVSPFVTENDTLVRFFGGSTLWGEGSADQHTIPSFYQQLNPQYNVRNHGQLAFNSRQNLAYLINLMSSGKRVDKVVFYDGVNDAAFLCPDATPVPGHRHVDTFRKKVYGSKKQLILGFVSKLFIDNINAAIVEMKKRSGKEYATYFTCYKDEDKIKKIAMGMVRNWEIAHKLVTTNGGEFVAVLQPVSFVGNPKTDHLHERDKNLGKSVEMVYAEVQQILKEKQYDWVHDLSDSFDGDEAIYIDFCHVSPNGNEIIAGKIHEVIRN